MFGTLRYDSQSNNAEFVDLTSEFLSNDPDAYAATHLACDVCRMKKLKCSGQKNGCDRCKVMSTPCVYATSGDSTARRRRRRGEDRSSARNQRLNSPSQSNSTSDFRNAISPLKMAPSDHIGNLQTEEVDELAMENSPSPMFEEDLFMSDQLLFDMIPDFGPQSSEGSIQNSKNSLHVDSDVSFRSPSGSLTTETWAVNERPVHMTSPFQAMRKSDVPTSSHSTSSSPSITTHSEQLFSDQPACRDKGNHSLPTMSTASTASTASTTPVMQIVQKSKNMNFTHNSSASCCCLQTIISLLENLENVSNLIESSTLDVVLAFHKKTLTQCSALVRCVTCTTRSEYLLLFVLVCEKLVDFCEKMVNEYLRRPRGRSEWLIESNSGDASESMACQRKLSIGKYDIDLPVELDCLFKVLMALQLKALGEILIKFRKTISLSRHGPKVSKIFNSERRLDVLLQNLQRSNATEPKRGRGGGRH